MKKNLFVFLSLAAITAASSTVAYGFVDPYAAAGTGITGSRHDINAFYQKTQYNNVVVDNQERVCAFCHTPHHAYTSDMITSGVAADYLPLWSHELSSKTYSPYASDTLQAVQATTDPLIGPSRLCMSCHDGIIAVDTHYVTLGTRTDGAQLTGDTFSSDPRQSGAVGAGNSLAGDHPIGFDYLNAQSADQDYSPTMVPGIRPATSQFRVVNGLTGFAYTGVKIQDTLFAKSGGEKRIMTCSSCHEVHNRDNVVQKTHNGTDMGVNYFLYGSQSGSQICLSCHDK